MLWLLYALGAAIIWGVNYAVSGRLLERGMSPQTLFLVDFGLWRGGFGVVDYFIGQMVRNSVGIAELPTRYGLGSPLRFPRLQRLDY